MDYALKHCWPHRAGCTVGSGWCVGSLDPVSGRALVQEVECYDDPPVIETRRGLSTLCSSSMTFTFTQFGSYFYFLTAQH